MPLSDTAIKNAKPAPKACKMTDEKGMYLYVTPSGGKLWRMQYRFENKQKLLALGKYPEVSLEEARERRDEARKLLANDVATPARSGRRRRPPAGSAPPTVSRR